MFKEGDIVTVVNPGPFESYKNLVGRPLTVIKRKSRYGDLTWFTGGGITDACFTWRLDFHNLNLENK